MPHVSANGVELCYETFGEGPPLVLVMGLGAQMVLWPDAFCHQLAARGFRVVRFDNRDVGRSTWLDDHGVPPMRRLIRRAALGLPVEAPYGLEDMARDVIGVLDALAIRRAHLVGASMGGMIAQLVAVRWPWRLRSLTSIMSHPGGLLYNVGRPEAMTALLRRVPREREAILDNHVRLMHAFSGPGHAFDADEHRELAGRAWDRGFHPEGFLRQMAAVLAAPPRRRALASVRVPSLVLHGTHDPLIRPVGGRDTARAIPGAQLRWIDGMGHTLPRQAWPELLSAIEGHARGVDAVGARASA